MMQIKVSSEKKMVVTDGVTYVIHPRWTLKEKKVNLFYSVTWKGIKRQHDEGESPIDCLQQAAVCYATAIKNKPKDPTYHLQLGHVLEEKYYAEDMMALRKEVTSFKRTKLL